MKPQKSSVSDEWINLSDVDISAIADPEDKIAECQFFLSLASSEKDVQRFRWLISAFLGAAYSFFEISALSAYYRFSDHETGEPIEDAQSLEVLRRYVKVDRDAKRPRYVKTAGHHSITKQLYEIRKSNTHHVPMSIMSTGQLLPEDFHFGYLMGQGIPALAFCRQAMKLIRQVNEELQE